MLQQQDFSETNSISTSTSSSTLHPPQVRNSIIHLKKNLSISNPKILSIILTNKDGSTTNEQPHINPPPNLSSENFQKQKKIIFKNSLPTIVNHPPEDGLFNNTTGGFIDFNFTSLLTTTPTNSSEKKVKNGQRHPLVYSSSENPCPSTHSTASLVKKKKSKRSSLETSKTSILPSSCTLSTLSQTLTDLDPVIPIPPVSVVPSFNTSSPLNVDHFVSLVSCMSCTGIFHATDKYLTCSSCAESHHFHCTSLHLCPPPLNDDPWICIFCTFCSECNQSTPRDQLVKCEGCTKIFHFNCIQVAPSLVLTGGTIFCNACTSCYSCAARPFYTECI
ncbi:hypothetical protein HMI55_003657, partial [Coelomomyces lativittatus]